MISVLIAPSFDRVMRKLEPGLLEAVSDAVEQFKNSSSHRRLKIHKLRGRLTGLHAFSVDYRHRIIFQWIKKNRQAILLDFGDHSMYE